MTTFPVFQDTIRLNMFKKGELPLFMSYYNMQGGYPNHHHEFVEMSLVTNGTGTQTVNGVEHPLRPGSVYLLLPHHLHAFTYKEDEPLKKFICMFDVNLLFQADFAELGQWLPRLSDDVPPSYDLQPAAFEAMQRVLAELWEEYQADRIGKQGVMRLKLLESVYMFFRSHPGFSALGQPAVSQPQEWEYIKYVNTHFMEESLSLEHVADRFHVSVFVVRNAFKKLLGRNFLEYLHLLRVRRAASLLAATDMSVSEIAYDVGFSSLRSFTRVFKETNGMSATDYRNAHAVIE